MVAELNHTDTLSLHDALPICLAAKRRRREHITAHGGRQRLRDGVGGRQRSRSLSGREDGQAALGRRSEEHTSELQSRQYLVCRLLLEKQNDYVRAAGGIPIRF